MSKIWYRCQNKDTNNFYYSSDATAEYNYFSGGGKTIEETIELITTLEKTKSTSRYNEVGKLAGVPIYKTKMTIPGQAVELPSGSYHYYYDGYSEIHKLSEVTFRRDTYLQVGDIQKEIENELNTFIQNAEAYKTLHVSHRMGVLLYGPPGEGKTSLIRNLVNTNEHFKDAIVITIGRSFPTVPYLKMLSESTKGRLKVFIFEEMTLMVNENDESEIILSFLDGESSVDTSISFATTNYPHRLPRNIVNRPGRFDKVYKIGHPARADRNILITYFYGSAPTEAFLDATEGLSTSYLKELSIVAKIKNISLDESLTRIKAMFAAVKDDFKETKMGF